MLIRRKLFACIALLALNVFAADNYDIEEQETDRDTKNAPHKMLPNFTLYSLIDCIEPGKVFYNETPDGQPLLCLQEQRFGDAYYFILGDNKISKDDLSALASKSFYSFVLSVSDYEQFQTLILKSSEGCAGKLGDWKKYTNWITNTWENLYRDNNFRLLDKERLRCAQNAPSQNSNPNFASWCCGPNSGFRALICLAETTGDYNTFVQNCPKTMSSEIAREKTEPFLPISAATLGFGIVLAPFTGGMSLASTMIPAAVSAAIYGGTHYAANNHDLSVGPLPKRLANYLDTNLIRHNAIDSSTDNIESARMMLGEELTSNRPVIVLIVSDTFSMHYVTLIGMKSTRKAESVCCQECFERGSDPDEFLLLNTNGEIGRISKADLLNWMDSEGYAAGFLKRFNFITFQTNYLKFMMPLLSPIAFLGKIK